MAVKIDSNFVAEGSIDSGLEALVTAASITTMHNAIVTQLGTSRYYIAIVYE